MATNVGSLTVLLGLDAADFVKGLTKAQQDATKALDAIRDGAVKALEVFGVAYGVDAFKDLIKSSIEAGARLDDLSKKAGVTATELGGIGFAAKQSGSDLESATQGITRLNKSIAEAAAGSAEAAEGFAAIGVSVKDANGNILPTTDILAKVSDAFAGYSDGANKTALAVRLFGRAGADMVPLLDEGGKKLQEQISYFQRYSGVTDETARQSHEFETTLTKLSLLTGSLGQNIAAQLLQPLGTLANLLLEAKEHGTLFQTVAEGLRTGLIGMASGAAFVVEQFEESSIELNRFLDNAAAIGRVLDAPILQIGQAVKQAAKDIHDTNAAAIQDTEAAEKKFQALYSKFNAPPTSFPSSTGTGKGDAPGLKAKGPSDFDALLKRATALNAQSQAELDAAQNQVVFNQAQKLGAEIADQYASNILKITPAQLGVIDALLKTASAAEQARQQLELNRKLDLEAAAETAAFRDSQEKILETYGKQATAAELLAQSYGLTDAELKALDASQIRANASILEGLAIQRQSEFLPDIAKLYSDQAAALTRSADAMDLLAKRQKDLGDGAKTFFAQYSEDALNANKTIQTFLQHSVGGLEDSLTSFLSTGKGNFSQLIDSMIADVERLYVVRPLLAKIFGTDGTNGWAGDAFSSLSSWAGWSGGSSSSIPVATNGFDIGAAYAQGTNYVPNDQVAFLHKGEAVVPAKYNTGNGGSGGDTHYHVNVQATPGMSRATAMQQGAAIGQGIQRALARNN